MNNGQIEKKEMEISISMLLKVFRKFWFVMAIATVVLAILGGAYSAIFQKTEYRTTSRFYVKNILTTSPVSEANFAAASRVADSCVDISKTDFLAEKAVEKHKLHDYFQCPKSTAVKYVKSMVSAGKRSVDSPEFYINVSSGNRDHAYKVALAIQDIMQDVVNDITSKASNSTTTPEILIVQKISTESDVSVIEPSALKLIVIGALAGLLISYIVCFIIYINDTKIYDEETIKTNFNYPILGTIPRWISDVDAESGKLSHKKLLERDVGKGNRKYYDRILNEKTPFGIAEAFKALRTNISYSVAISDKAPVFVITSDFSGAGKSIVSVNTALSFAQCGKKVLLVEVDMRAPNMKNIFAKASTPVGLSEFLSGNLAEDESPISDVGHENLSVVFSGRVSPNPSELLGSEKMRDAIENWRRDFDIIIIDTPPVVEVTDASVIASFVDGYLLVVRSEYSDVNAISESIDILNRVQGNISGFILNDKNPKNVLHKGSYIYGKYGKYGKYRKYSSYGFKNND